MRLKDLTKGATVKGVLPNQVITVIDTQWHGSDVVTLTYINTNGVTGEELIFHDCPKCSDRANCSLGTFVSQVGKNWVRTLKCKSN